MKVLLRKSNRFRNKIENHIHLIITNKKKIQICKSNLYKTNIVIDILYKISLNNKNGINT